MYIHRIITYNLGRSMSGPFQVSRCFSNCPAVQPRSLFAASCWEGFLAPEKEQAAGCFHFFCKPEKYAHQIGSSPRNSIWNDLLMKILWQIHRKTQKAPPFWACLHCIWISPDRPADSSWSPFCNFRGQFLSVFSFVGQSKRTKKRNK